VNEEESEHNKNVKILKSETVKTLNRVLKIINRPIVRILTPTTIQKSLQDIDFNELLDALSNYELNETNNKQTLELGDIYKETGDNIPNQYNNESYMKKKEGGNVGFLKSKNRKQKINKRRYMK
jgi:hypothetical protein